MTTVEVEYQIEETAKALKVVQCKIKLCDEKKKKHMTNGEIYEALKKQLRTYPAKIW